jgi:membrane dipeptidase
MVNFYSGFLVPEGARAVRKLAEVARGLRAKYADDEKGYEEAMRAWLKANDFPAGTVHDIVDHIDHIVKVAGIDHVGLGSDFDGVSRLPHQMDDVSRYPLITQELLNRGYTKEQIHKVLGGNLMRAFAAAEKASRELRGAGR